MLGSVVALLLTQSPVINGQAFGPPEPKHESIWGAPEPKPAPPARAAPVHHAAPAWEPAPPKPEPANPFGAPAPAPAPRPAAAPLAPAGPAARPPPAAGPERPEKEGDVDLMDDEEMDDPDWYRDNEARVPCFKFGETGLYNL